MMNVSHFSVDCSLSVCRGDRILFTEAVFGGSYRKPRFLGERRIAAEVMKESYGAAKQQHTFTLRVLWSDGQDAVAPGTVIRRKGRNVYRNGVMRMPWPNEDDRVSVLEEKRERGRAAQAERFLRRREESDALAWCVG